MRLHERFDDYMAQMNKAVLKNAETVVRS